MNADSKNTVIILRGCSGSGKSTLASLFGPAAVVVSADDFFITDAGYKFDINTLTNAHKLCKDKFDKAIACNTPVIIVDNTNTMSWEFAYYEETAKEHDYRVVSLVGDTGRLWRSNHSSSVVASPEEWLTALTRF